MSETISENREMKKIGTWLDAPDRKDRKCGKTNAARSVKKMQRLRKNKTKPKGGTASKTKKHHRISTHTEGRE